MSFEIAKKAGLLACALVVASGSSAVATEVATDPGSTSTTSGSSTVPTTTAPSTPETLPDDPPTETVPTTTTTTEDPASSSPAATVVGTNDSTASSLSPTTTKTETSGHTSPNAFSGSPSYSVSVNKVKLLADGSLNVSILCITSKLTVCTGKVRVSAGLGTIGRDTFKVVSGRNVWININISHAGMEYLRDQSAPKVRVNLVSSVNASAASLGKAFKVHPKKKRSKSKRAHAHN